MTIQPKQKFLTEWGKEVLRHRRFRRRMIQEGYEHVTDNGGNLWQLDRGSRTSHQITDVIVDSMKKTLWVKIAPRDTKQ